MAIGIKFHGNVLRVAVKLFLEHHCAANGVAKTISILLPQLQLMCSNDAECHLMSLKEFLAATN